VADDQLQGQTDPQEAWNRAKELGKSPGTPYAMGKALLNEAFPYLSPPTQAPSMEPNEAGKVPVADPLSTPLPYAQGAVDAASWLSPGMFAKGGSLAALHLMPLSREAGHSTNMASYKILNDAGHHVLDLLTSYRPKAKELSVDWIGPRGTAHYNHADPMADIDYSEGVNELGPTDIRSLVKELRGEYPDMTKIVGERVSGARSLSGKTGKASLDIKPGSTKSPIKE
jgi:hypothetical protein